MSLRSLEAEILAELRILTGDRTIRQKDIMEWSTSPVTPQGDEVMVSLQNLHINVTYLPREKKPAAPPVAP